MQNVYHLSITIIVNHNDRIPLSFLVNADSDFSARGKVYEFCKAYYGTDDIGGTMPRYTILENVRLDVDVIMI